MGEVSRSISLLFFQVEKQEEHGDSSLDVTLKAEFGELHSASEVGYTECY